MKAAMRIRRTRLLSTALALAAGAVLTGPIAEARIVRIEITSKESPAPAHSRRRSGGYLIDPDRMRRNAHGADVRRPQRRLAIDDHSAAQCAGAHAQI